MASKSIIDRVLLVAAALCAAGLVWQLTVLLTSKGKLPGSRGIEMSASAAVAPSAPASPPVPATDQTQAKAATADTPPDTAAVRVVYPGPDAPKTTVKASDPPPPATSPSPDQTAAAAPPMPAATPQPSVVPVAMVAPAPSVGTPPAAPAETTPPPAPAQAASLQDDADQPAAATPAPAVELKPAGGAININKASVESLNRLRGGGHIGQAIASHRPYKSVEDLVKRRILRRDVYERIRGQLAAQ